MRPLTGCRFVRAGSILPLGDAIESTSQVQKIAKVRVYPGADAEFALYQDDGMTYAYEHGDSRITHLRWNDATHTLDHQGAPAWTAPDSEIVDVVRAGPASGALANHTFAAKYPFRIRFLEQAA